MGSVTPSLVDVVVLGQSEPKRTLLYMEAAAPPDTVPYLVSSSRSFIWIERPPQSNRVRVGFRQGVDVGSLFREIVDKVAVEGARRMWGNVHPPTVVGVQAAVDHLKYYGISDVEVLSGPVSDPALVAVLADASPVSWLPENTAVVVPKDRGYLGAAWRFGEDCYALLIHNASRGLAVVWPG